MAERRHKWNSTFKKWATVNSVICWWPSYNIHHRRKLTESCV